MNLSNRFQRGDEVFHPRRPEWGRGVVKEAFPITHEGASAQRLAVDFANRGRVVINTAVASLTAKGEVHEMTRTSPQRTGSGAGWLSELERSTNGGGRHELWDLPEAMTDPFASHEARLRATLDSYRFSTQARSLIEWAIAQTGLNDPLSTYTRHDLEQAFPRYARDRDQHLLGLVRLLKKNGRRDVLDQIMQQTKNADARNALSKAIRN